MKQTLLAVLSVTVWVLKGQKALSGQLTGHLPDLTLALMGGEGHLSCSCSGPRFRSKRVYFFAYVKAVTETSPTFFFLREPSILCFDRHVWKANKCGSDICRVWIGQYLSLLCVHKRKKRSITRTTALSPKGQGNAKSHANGYLVSTWVVSPLFWGFSIPPKARECQSFRNLKGNVRFY